MLLLAAAAFVGSAACRPCHLKISEDYAQTPMARSSGRVGTLDPARFTAAGHRYRIANNRLYFDGGDAPFDYFIGSNTAGRSFLLSRENYLFELPVTWYRDRRGWDASPGYERDPEVRLSRAIDPTCLYCHASRLQPIYGTQNRYADPPFLEHGVSCERCHGPGGDHVRNPVAARMVNPAKLAPEERDSVCAQCHLTGEARIERPGRRFAEYRPGARLSDYVTYLVWKDHDPGMKVTSHVEKLAMSRCRRESGGAMWCGTCHEVHSNGNRTQAACLSCHADAHHASESCASCHMRHSAASDVAHGVATDHSIPGARRSAPVGRSLVAFEGAADDRALGLAYAELGDPRAREYLLRAQPADAPVLLRLGRYEEVLRRDPANPVALVNLGVVYARSGRTEDAARLWEKALTANPAIEGAALNLAKISPPDKARAILTRYLGFNPGSKAAHHALEALP
ncbi:MAG TPA: tetratricopeptide repeat protein [Bryobacteraceae bacterium]|nr:tetratricopeptide repeat protein [Bryobacteraceae bacterium]